MWNLVIAFTALQMQPPAEPLAGQLRAEIWYDIQSNALIGNGNELLAKWANADSDREDAPQLHIQDLNCAASAAQLDCRFLLLRDGGAATYLGETVTDRLACATEFHRSETNARWYIPRLPPDPSGGHTRITIECKPAT